MPRKPLITDQEILPWMALLLSITQYVSPDDAILAIKGKRTLKRLSWSEFMDKYDHDYYGMGKRNPYARRKRCLVQCRV